MSNELDVRAVAIDLRVALKHLNRRMRQQAPVVDLTRSQLNALARLERDGPATANDLARAEGIRPQSMSTIVSALTGGGWVTRTPDSRDGRKTILVLSEYAREAFRANRFERDDWLARRLADTLSDAELREIVDAIALMRRLAGE